MHELNAGVIVYRPGSRRAAFPLALGILGGLLCLSFTGTSQTAGINQGGPGYIHTSPGSSPISQQSGQQTASPMDRMRQAEQHRHIAADTAKLVELSTQLKAAVDAAPADQLSLDVMRKAAEIEKTAHDLKGWMNY